jgi:anaerobic magnesium-protoporphyrin IX monomethyl ester cyclase
MKLLIVAPSAAGLYQDLANGFSAIEPNIWAGLLANSVRDLCEVRILDQEVERYDARELRIQVTDYDPSFVLFVVTGQNPNASSAAMAGATVMASVLDQECEFQYPIGFVGPHVNALPVETLERHPSIKFCLANEGVYALKNLVKGGINDLGNVNGVVYRDDSGDIQINPPEAIVPQDRLEIDLPGVAYDLMPSLDNYRTSTWHCNYIEQDRSPFASIYTSLGCPMQCSFCMINIINRTDNDWTKAAADFNTFRHWSPEFVIKQFDYLASKGVKQVKIADELFVLRPRHFIGLCDLLIERDYGFNIWAYSRIDTVRPHYLTKLKAAGVNYLALGIESANQTIRREISKGKFEDVNIREVVAMIEDHGINVGANYIVGLGHDTWDTMQETLNLAIELNTAAMNIYAATPLPGSPLYLAKRNAGETVPTKYSEFGFLSYDHLPSATPSLSAEEVLGFRDYAWQAYHTNPRFLNRIRNEFGDQAVADLKRLTDVKLNRKILGD